MEFALQICGYVIGLPLEVLIIAALWRGQAYKRFPFPFLYTLCVFVVTIVEIPIYVAHYTGDAQYFRSRAWVYWAAESVLLPLMLMVVLSLIWKSISAARTRRMVRAGAILVTAIFALGSLWLHYNPTITTGKWMSTWTRDLYFASAVLDLGLWMMLAANRDRDRTVLLLSGGLGIQFAGEALGQSIRTIAVSAFATPTQGAYTVAFCGNFAIMAANLACLWVWRQAFNTKEPAQRRIEAGVNT